MSIVTVTLNPAFDLTLQLPQLHLGQVNDATKTQLHPAGKGVNVAVVLQKLGQDVLAIGLLGHDSADVFEQFCQQQNISTQWITIRGQTRINVKIAEQNGRITDLNTVSNTHIDNATQQKLQTLLHTLCPKHDLFVFSGSVPACLDDTTYYKLMTPLIQAGKKVALDTSGHALKQGIAAKPWLIKPNRQELEQYVQHPLDSKNAVIDAARQLNQQGIEHVIISDGANGVYWITSQYGYHAIPPPVEVISTVGAGDTLVAGMLNGLCQGHPPEQTLRYATALCASSVTHIGVHAIQLDKIETFIAQTRLESI